MLYPELPDGVNLKEFAKMMMKPAPEMKILDLDGDRKISPGEIEDALKEFGIEI